MSTESEPSLGDINRRLAELREDIREFRSSFLSEKAWEDWRRENYGPRIERLENAVKELIKRIDDAVAVDNSRFRSNVNSVLQGVVYPIAVVLILAYIAIQK